MQLQPQFPADPSRRPAAKAGEYEVRVDWKQPVRKAPAGGGNPLVEVPPEKPVVADSSAPTKAPAPSAPPPPLLSKPDQIAQAIRDLIHILPGKPAAVGLENGLIGIVMCLDADTQKVTVPILEEHCGYQPYRPPVVLDGPSLNAHILIVEDAYISRLVLRRVIEQLPGCTVTEAVNGSEALELLKKGLNPDLMISDVCMPELDGIQLLTQIRATPYLCDLEVMFCTSTTERETVVRAAELGVNRYLVKPFQPDAVRDQIREALVASQARANDQIQQLKDRMGLTTGACGELFHQLAEQIRDEVKTFRNELGAGKHHAAVLTLQRLRGSCALIKDNTLVGRVQTVLNAAHAKDLFAIVKGLEMVEAEGKRLATLATKLRRAGDPGGGGMDPLSQAAARVKAV